MPTDFLVFGYDKNAPWIHRARASTTRKKNTPPAMDLPAEIHLESPSFASLMSLIASMIVFTASPSTASHSTSETTTLKTETIISVGSLPVVLTPSDRKGTRLNS